MRTRLVILCLTLAAALGLRAATPSTADDADTAAGTRFAWGAALRTAVDLSQHDMSTIGMEASAGIRTGAIDLLGVGASYNTSVTSGARQMPVFLTARTGFSTRPTLCFAEVQSGISVNYTEGDERHTGPYLSVALGVNLARGAAFSSHLLLGYVYTGSCAVSQGQDGPVMADVHSVGVRLGITF